MTTLAMFPLGSVLFPTMVLPLHVFEPRYRQLMEDCLAGDLEFGVCLISRGSEVGGGDTRTDVGTVAQIVDAQQFDDGRWVVAAVGTRRIRILAWLAEDPYPRADVENWIDEQSEGDLTSERDQVVALLRELIGLQARLGQPAPSPDVTIDVDPTLASYQVATLSPLGPFDRQQLLATPDTAGRLARLATMLREAERDLQAQLDLG